MKLACVAVFFLAGFTSFGVDESSSGKAAGFFYYTYRYSYYSYYSGYGFTYATYNRYRSSRMNTMKRYSRVYYSYSRLGIAYYYERQYSYVSRLYAFRAQLYYSSARKCGNFETNVYGDFVGFFSCPLFFEPNNFTYCCGTQGSHYCCDKSLGATPYSSEPSFGSDVITYLTIQAIIGIAISCVVGVVIFAVVIGCLCKNSGYRGSIRRTAPTTTVMSTTAGATVITQASGQPPAYPAQPTYPAQPMQPMQPMAPPMQPMPPPYSVAPPSYPPPNTMYPPMAPVNDPAYPPPPRPS